MPARPLVRSIPLRDVSARLAVRLTTAGTPERPPDAGMTTAEYAVGTVAACGFSGVLYKLLTSDAILGLLRDVITKAFRLGF